MCGLCHKVLEDCDLEEGASCEKQDCRERICQWCYLAMAKHNMPDWEPRCRRHNHRHFTDLLASWPRDALGHHTETGNGEWCLCELYCQ